MSGVRSCLPKRPAKHLRCRRCQVSPRARHIISPYILSQLEPAAAPSIATTLQRVHRQRSTPHFHQTGSRSAPHRPRSAWGSQRFVDFFFRRLFYSGSTSSRPSYSCSCLSELSTVAQTDRSRTSRNIHWHYARTPGSSQYIALASKAQSLCITSPPYAASSGLSA